MAPEVTQKTVIGTRPAQRSTIDLLIQLFPELAQHRLQMIAHTYGDNKIMAIENALAIRRAQVGLFLIVKSYIFNQLKINCFTFKDEIPIHKC